MFVIINGKLVKEEKAVVSVNNRSFRYGDGCFETMRIVNGSIPLAGLHFERLFHTLAELQFEIPALLSRASLQNEITLLADKNDCLQSARVRLTIYRGNGGLYDSENLRANWLIQAWPIPPVSPEINGNGLQMGIYDKGFKATDHFANLKTNNFLLYALAALHAKQQHWNDALVLNQQATIADSSIANLFLVAGKTIFTPPLSDGPVNGVMRRYLLQQLPLIGFEVIEKSLGMPDVLEADEAFASNAIYGIKWIGAIGEKQFRLLHAAAIYRQIILPVFS